MRHDTIVDGIEYKRSRLGSKIPALKKRPGFNVPQSEPFALRATKYALYQTKISRFEIAYSSGIQARQDALEVFWRKRMMKNLRMK